MIKPGDKITCVRSFSEVLGKTPMCGAIYKVKAVPSASYVYLYGWELNRRSWDIGYFIELEEWIEAGRAVDKLIRNKEY